MGYSPLVAKSQTRLNNEAQHVVDQQCCDADFGSTYSKIGMIQRRLARPLCKDNSRIHEAFHVFNIIPDTCHPSLSWWWKNGLRTV